SRMGNRHPSIAPYELLRCREGELVVAVGDDRQFGELCEVLGAPELAADERFGANPARVENRDELKPLLEAALAARPAAEWVEPLTARRVPAGVVNDIGAAFAFAERIGLDPIVEIPREDGAPVRLPRNPIRLSKTPASYRLPPPRLP
ncbi:MAG TPA: CoA transferase, partial [Solirubrobacterales bacterium]|nr:CoA transferase [Solirubrobacterales bacterium]